MTQLEQPTQAGAPHGLSQPALAPRPIKRTSPALVLALVGLGLVGSLVGSFLLIEGTADPCSKRSAELPKELAELPILDGAKVCLASEGKGGHAATVDLGLKSGPTLDGKGWLKEVAVKYMALMGGAGWDGVDCGRSTPSSAVIESLCFERDNERLDIDLQLNERPHLIHTAEARIRLDRYESKRRAR
ncbi:MAG: hypothetical protein IPM79_17320 [Polyangiaceae bacterium]|nr:hypothetical protein [Polyangiaceae bacterium]MBK8939328.1 hypothetical protein [Polyangiaceae bacterium]